MVVKKVRNKNGMSVNAVNGDGNGYDGWVSRGWFRWSWSIGRR